jgi:hypothetical protein
VQPESNNPSTTPSVPKSSTGLGKISVHPGVKMRLLQVFNPKRDPQEQAATSHLLSNTDPMPQHMREQFLNSQL